MNPKPRRLEWISLLYLVFFALAVMSPSLYSHGYLGLPQDTLEELTIFAFGLAGLITFTVYERVMERREKERDQAHDAYQRAQNELIESYTYIGSVNRKIELLKSLSADTAAHLQTGKVPREVFQAVAAGARSAVDAKFSMIRFVELERLRTEREFAHSSEGWPGLKIANKDLRAVHDNGQTHAVIRSEDGADILVIPSDHSGPYKGYLLLQIDAKRLPEMDTALLKVFANQAETLYQHFATTR